MGVAAAERGEEKESCLLGLLNLVSPDSLCNYVVLPWMSPRHSPPKFWSNLVMKLDARIYGLFYR